MPTTRFAPSPTGFLHVGHARMALVNWLVARGGEAKDGKDGRFVLRIDDLDRDQARNDFVEAIERDLHWLGITWDETVFQSSRMDRYARATEELLDKGRLYACYETAEELAHLRRRQIAQGRPPLYNRAALDLSAAQVRGLEDAGRRPHWRFLLRPADMGWRDGVRGAVTFQGGTLGDPILIRSDGRVRHTLASIIDDMEMGVTDVIRGDNHLITTAVQIQLLEALGAEPARMAFFHLPLIADVERTGVAEDRPEFRVETMRDRGMEPMALNRYLARIGTGKTADTDASLEDLVAQFDLKACGRITPRFHLGGGAGVA
jgi:glutamyl-tRNA synthetase